MSFAKHLVRYAVVAGLVGGTAVLVAGPDRAGAMFSQFRTKVNETIDRNIDDPIALRAQMKKLESAYPQRIAAVRGDLSELREQVSQLNREMTVSHRVVSLAEQDLTRMQSLIGKAETTQASLDGGAAIVRVVFDNESLNLRDAYGRANKIQQVRQAYANRTVEIDRDLGYLTQQEERLAGLLTQLETEHQEFQAQLWQMDRQVDSIARNERLIEMMEKRQRTIDDQGRYGAVSLDQLASKFADIRGKQESRLQSLAHSANTLNYEERAKFELDARPAASLPSGWQSPQRHSPTIIEITPDDHAPAGEHTPATKRPIAMKVEPVALRGR
jgi:DNA repair exonuclease SbcCD ATPase subunit